MISPVFAFAENVAPSTSQSFPNCPVALLGLGITIKIQKMLNWSIKRYYLQILKRSLEYGEYRYLEIKLKLMVKLMIE